MHLEHLYHILACEKVKKWAKDTSKGHKHLPFTVATRIQTILGKFWAACSDLANQELILKDKTPARNGGLFQQVDSSFNSLINDICMAFTTQGNSHSRHAHMSVFVRKKSQTSASVTTRFHPSVIRIPTVIPGLTVIIHPIVITVIKMVEKEKSRQSGQNTNPSAIQKMKLQAKQKASGSSPAIRCHKSKTRSLLSSNLKDGDAHLA